MKSLFQKIKDKDFTGMRKWVFDNLDNDPTTIFRRIYDNSIEYFQPNSIPQLIVLIGEYQYKSGFVSDQEINFVAFLTEVVAKLNGHPICDVKLLKHWHEGKAIPEAYFGSYVPLADFMSYKILLVIDGNGISSSH